MHEAGDSDVSGQGVPPSMRPLPVLWKRDRASVHAGPNAYHLLNSGKAAYWKDVLTN